MARAGRWQDGFSFGGRLPWAVGLVMSITIALSLFVAFGSRHAAPLFELGALTPGEVWRGQVWRLVTWAFIEPSPLGLIVTCFTLYWFGRDLAEEWGSPRFLTRVALLAILAGGGTCLVAQIDRPVLAHPYLGAWPLTCAMIVAWGLWFSQRVVRIYFVLPVRGYWLAWLVVAITAIFAVYFGWQRFLPHLFAEGTALAFIYRESFAARFRRVRLVAEMREHEAQRRKRAKLRAKSEEQLHVLASQDEEPPPLPPELEDKVRDLLAGRIKPDRR